MTGFYPTYHGVRLNGTTALSQTQTTLAEAFAQQGYQTGAFVGAFVLDGRWGLNQGFGVYDDQFDLKKFKHIDLAAVQRPANEVIDAALHWLDGAQEHTVFRLGPPVRRAQPLRAAGAVALRVPESRSPRSV